MYFETDRDESPLFSVGDNICVAHLHRSTELLYVLKGEKTAYIDGKEYRLTADSVLLVPPYAVHVILPEEGGEQVALTVQAEYAARFEQFIATREPVCHAVRGSEEMKSLVFAVPKASNQITYEGTVNRLLGLIIEQMNFAPKKAGGGTTPVREITQFIDENYATQLTLPMLAKQFGYAPNYFSALFHRYFRMSVPQYVNAVRVRKSLPLLKDKTVTAVSYECGFNNPQSYFLAFKREFGCSPYQYLHARK